MTQLEITYYTDPLCCWSWCFEPVIQKLRNEFGDEIKWRYCMGGLIPTWKAFIDPVNHVTRPLQMGPVWMHASVVGELPIDSTLWYHDPPASSYPACVGVKAAALQGIEHGEKYLSLLREACIVKRINIAKREHLEELAAELHRVSPEFDVKTFSDDLVNGRGSDAFRRDLHEVNTRQICRFPTLLLKNGKDSVIATGFRPSHVIEKLIHDLQGGSIKSLHDKQHEQNRTTKPKIVNK